MAAAKRKTFGWNFNFLCFFRSNTCVTMLLLRSWQTKLDPRSNSLKKESGTVRCRLLVQRVRPLNFNIVGNGGEELARQPNILPCSTCQEKNFRNQI